MNNKRLSIGGEFWYQNQLQDDGVENNIHECATLLSGGISAIQYIISEINLNEGELILLPTYLCPTIITIIDKLGIKYKLYEVTETLSINIDNIKKMIKDFKVRAVFIINYFGFYHNNKVTNFIRSIKYQGIIVVEDAVQIFWIKKRDEFVGDYIFNSYRKFLPIDGSVVIHNKKDLFEEVDDNYFNLMESAREYKTKFLAEGLGDEEEMLKIFSKAHDEYYKRERVFGINKKYIEFLNHVPEEYLSSIRKSNYEYLYNKLNGNLGIRFIYNIEDLKRGVPLALPILVENRDKIKIGLMKFNIFAPVHWKLSENDILTNNKIATEISKNIISLPIDWRYNFDDMDYLFDKLINVMKSLDNN